MRCAKMRKELLRRVELPNRQHERVEHPAMVQANVARLICQRRLQVERARRKHSRVIDRALEQGAKRSGGHDLNSTLRSQSSSTALHGFQASPCWGRSSVIVSHGAREST